MSSGVTSPLERVRHDVEDEPDIDPSTARPNAYGSSVLLAQLRRPSDELVARGEPPRGRAEAEHGDGPAVAVVDGVAHLGADQGLVAEIVVAGDELVPQLALAGPASDGPQVERADLVEGCRGREQRRLGVRSEDDRTGSALPLLVFFRATRRIPSMRT